MQGDTNEKRWIVGIALGLFAVLIGLGVRLGYFHLANHSRVKRNDHTQVLLGVRGRIFDGSGNPIQMAVSLPQWRFYADRYSFREKHKRGDVRAGILTNVSEVLDLPYETVVHSFSTNVTWGSTLAFSTDSEVYDALMRRSREMSGIKAQDVALRSYPHGSRMAHVVGFVDWRGIGVAGIEQRLEEHLKGTDGWSRDKLDGRDLPDVKERVIPEKNLGQVQPIHGSDVYLTLDSNIQYYVETALKETVEKFNAQGAWAIVQDVRTGAILAMAVYPDFDPNAIKEGDGWRNDAISTPYEPGSVMKTVTLAAALNERMISANTQIDVGYGPFVYAGTTLKNTASGKITVARGFKISNNVVFAKLGLDLRPQRIDAYMRGFGFGERLDIELPDEARGMIDAKRRSWKEWDKVKPTRVPIGQGISVTALQMINAYSAVANGGKLMRPYLVRQVVSSAGEVVHQGGPQEIGRPIRPEVAQVVRELMLDVTEEGTGTKARVPGYTVAGKTGTAQAWDSKIGAYSTTDYYGSFVGFVPARDPVFSVLVTVDRGRPVYTGGAVAAPIFAQIATPTARYLAVPPDDLPNEQAGEQRSASVGAR